MQAIDLPKDFKEFLQILNSHEVKYLLIGGYAVGYYGYIRTTGDMDVWIAIQKENAQKMVAALQEFGFNVPGLSSHIFLKENRITRMGLPPMRIEILTSISGVSFAECYAKRIIAMIDDVEVNLISLEDLKTNKKASGRLKDLNDLANLS